MPRTKAKPAKIRYHRILELPPLPPDQYEGLRASIAVHGVLVPIHVDSDGPRRGIIDGNYRKDIANQLGYDCPEIVLSGLEEDEKRTLARALNIARRSLNTDQKRQLIADQLQETPQWTNRRTAKMLGVSHPTVASVRAELEGSGKIYHLATREGCDGRLQPASKLGSSSFVFNGGTVANPRQNTIATPPGICRFLHDLIAPCYKVKTILDPSAGAGALTKPWKGAKVIAYEISKGKDFFSCPNRIQADLVLCNPPFNNTNGETRFLPQLFLERILKGRAAKNAYRVVHADGDAAGPNYEVVSVAVAPGSLPADHEHHHAAPRCLRFGEGAFGDSAFQYAQTGTALLSAGSVSAVGEVMSNQILAIAPYWLEEVATWVFDDPQAGLSQEPFVSGVPEMIDVLVKDIPNARSGFRLLFSATPFPGYQRRLVWKREEFGGNWYASDDPPMEGWLCPALFRYFDATPAELYVKAEAKP